MSRFSVVSILKGYGIPLELSPWTAVPISMCVLEYICSFMLCSNGVIYISIYIFINDWFLCLGTWRTMMEESSASSEEKDVWPCTFLLPDLSPRSRLVTLGYDAGMVTWSSPWPALTLPARAKVWIHNSIDKESSGILCLDFCILYRNQVTLCFDRPRELQAKPILWHIDHVGRTSGRSDWRLWEASSDLCSTFDGRLAGTYMRILYIRTYYDRMMNLETWKTRLHVS
jgi:hypothetical protein